MYVDRFRTGYRIFFFFLKVRLKGEGLIEIFCQVLSAALDLIISRGSQMFEMRKLFLSSGELACLLISVRKLRIEEVSDRNKTERRNRQLLWRRQRVAAVKKRRRQEGSAKWGQVQHHIVPVRWLKREAEEECLAPGDAWGMLTTGRKNRLFRVQLFQALAWFREVSAKQKRLPTSSEVLGKLTRKIRTGGWQLTLMGNVREALLRERGSQDLWLIWYLINN